jgi:hypothetical protein
MKTILVATITLVLAAGWPARVSAQTPADQKKIPLATVKVQSHHVSPAHARTGNRPGYHSAVEYQENDISAARFGSAHWWTVQGWQAGGSSPP